MHLILLVAVIVRYLTFWENPQWIWLRRGISRKPWILSQGVVNFKLSRCRLWNLFLPGKKTIVLTAAVRLHGYVSFRWALYCFAFSNIGSSLMLFNCSWTKFIAIIVNVLVFFMQIFLVTVLRFSSRTFFDFWSDFLTLSCFIFEWSLFLSLRSKACC